MLLSLVNFPLPAEYNTLDGDCLVDTHEDPGGVEGLVVWRGTLVQVYTTALETSVN